MLTHRSVSIPGLVRIKPGCLGRVGIYARRHEWMEVVLLHSADLRPELMQSLRAGLERECIHVLECWSVEGASFERALELFSTLPAKSRAVIGCGGGKALDVAKYVSFLSQLPYLAVPTSLSNDGIASPQASLSVAGRRKSLPAAMPFGVLIDTEVCLAAPEILWLAGVGDLLAKLTAVTDWKLAFKAVGTPVDDFAALLSDATVFQWIARPHRDLEGVRLMATSLMLNGIAMGVCGSSRPASGSEHLVSHALDSLCEKPRLHGLQVGVATYLVSLLQGNHSELIAEVFETTGFWRAIAAHPFLRAEWLEAVRLAPAMKEDFYTVLSSRDCLPEVEEHLRRDPWLRSCFAG